MFPQFFNAPIWPFEIDWPNEKIRRGNGPQIIICTVIWGPVYLSGFNKLGYR